MITKSSVGVAGEVGHPNDSLDSEPRRLSDAQWRGMPRHPNGEPLGVNTERLQCPLTLRWSPRLDGWGNDVTIYHPKTVDRAWLHRAWPLFEWAEQAKLVLKPGDELLAYSVTFEVPLPCGELE